ncbi:MAG: hypothetical protein QG559_1476 [Campylobacterota bacterium]|nr:hypothetical protein [Campylobacterota bacterium]
MNISNNISSIQAHQTMLNSSAHNVANVNTDRFVPSDTKMTENENSVQANVRKSDDNASMKSQTDLSKEMTDQMITEKAVAANVNAIKTKGDMMGSLLDIKA